MATVFTLILIEPLLIPQLVLLAMTESISSLTIETLTCVLALSLHPAKNQGLLEKTMAVDDNHEAGLHAKV